MGKLFYDLTVGVSVGVLTAALALVANWQWSLIQGWFDKEIRRQAGQIGGQWEATEVFADSTQDTYILEINPKGRRITGTLKDFVGPDKGYEFDIEGTFKDLILTFMWTKKGPRSLESGTTTAKLVQDGSQLEGHGLYIEPDDGKVYTSTFTAKYRPRL